MRKTLKIISYVLSVLVLCTLGFVGIRYFDEIRTLTSLKLVEGTNLYTMEFFSNYRFDEFLETGASNNNEYYEFVNKIVDSSVNINVNTSNVKDACSAFTFRDKDGKRYLGRNYDYVANPVMLIVTSPDDASKSISTVNMTTLGFNAEKTPR